VRAKREEENSSSFQSFRFFPDYAGVCIYVLTPKRQGEVESVISNEYPSQVCEAKEEGCGNYNKTQNSMEWDKTSARDQPEKSSNSLPVMHSTCCGSSIRI
jgi:hypothetical protein